MDNIDEKKSYYDLRPRAHKENIEMTIRLCQSLHKSIEELQRTVAALVDHAEVATEAITAHEKTIRTLEGRFLMYEKVTFDD